MKLNSNVTIFMKTLISKRSLRNVFQFLPTDPEESGNSELCCGENSEKRGFRYEQQCILTSNIISITKKVQVQARVYTYTRHYLNAFESSGTSGSVNRNQTSQ